VIFLTFIGFNLDNRCDIRFWFGENGVVEQVPVFFTAFAGFVLGLLWSVPFAISLSRKRKKKEKDAALPSDLAETLAQVDALAGPPPRKKRGKKGDDHSLGGNGGPYGID
jgi:hypothetical protein